MLTSHNPTYRQRLTAGARHAIEEDRFAEYCAEKYAGWGR